MSNTNTSSVPTEETGPVAPEEQGQSEELLAGKFKSVEEMAAAYAELEAKLGKPEGEQEGEADEDKPKDETEQPEADETGYVPPTEDKTDEDRQYEVDTYGPALAEVFEKAGLHAKHVGEFFHEHGKFPETAYKALEEQGLSRAAIDSYLGGATAKAADNAEMAERDVQEIKESVGGEQEYSGLMAWASKNLTQPEADEFNEAISHGKAATKFAVQALYARYTDARGTPEPKTYGGKSGGVDDVGRYNSQHEMLADMRDPRYKKGDKAFHAQVRQKLANSNIFG